MENFAALLSLVKEFIIVVWDIRKKILNNGDNLDNLSLSPRMEIGSLSLGLGGSVLVSWIYS